MPKEQLQINTFRGLYPSADSRDLPDDAPSYVENVDFVAGEPGSLMGLPSDTLRISSGVNGGAIFAPLQDGDTYIYHDGSGISSLDLDAYSVTSEATAATDGTASLASDGEAVHVGRGPNSSYAPKWVGYIQYGQFGGGAPSGIQVEDATISPPDFSGDYGSFFVSYSISSGDNDDDGPFQVGHAYRYACSLVLDGFQESPIQSNFPSGLGSRVVSPTGQNKETLTVEISLQNVGDMPKRVSAVNVYRSEASPAGRSSYTLVKSIDINDSGWSGSGKKTFSFSDDYVTGRTFEEGTGLPETLEHMQLHYGLSTVSDGYHIIGKPWHPELKEIGTYLFRSELERFDMFNWAENHLRLPTEPVALVTFMGKVWAFCEGKIYRISPTGFGIEEEYEGIGAISRRSVVVTDRGMFFASDYNLYWHNGGQIHPIGEPVFKSDDKAAAGYLSRDSSVDTVTLYDPKRDLVLFCFNGSDNANYAWAFHVTTQTWMTVVTLPSGNIQGGFISTDGRPFLVIGGKLYEVFNGASNRNWEWRSKEIHDGGLPFNVYHARIRDEPLDAGSGVTLKYVENGGTATTQASRTDKGGGVYEYVVNSDTTVPWGKVRNFQLYLTGDGNDRVKDVTLIWRRRSAR